MTNPRKLAPHVQAAIAATAQPKLPAPRRGAGAGTAGRAGVGITSHVWPPAATIQRCGLFDCLSAWWNRKKPADRIEKEPDKLKLITIDKQANSQLENKQTSDIKSGAKHTCTQGQTVNGNYGDSVHGGYVSSCALVFFRGDDTFTCYHAPGGLYQARKSSHAREIDYVVSSDGMEVDALVKAYEKNYNLYQKEFGCPLNFYSQAGTPQVNVYQIGVTKIGNSLVLIKTVT